MNDPHPTNFEIEIDRESLKKYLRTKSILVWLGPLGLYGGLFGLLVLCKQAEQGEVHSWIQVLALLRYAVMGLVIGTALGSVCYLILSRWRAARFAEAIRVSVEGPFVRIRQFLWTYSDRKLHFRSIVDYTVVQGPLMRRFGIEALRMSTAACGQNSFLTIHGVKDCLRVRDMLAEIDSQRENG